MLPEFHNKFQPHHAFAFGYGIEGLRDVVQWAQNTATFNPLSRFVSKFNPESQIKSLQQIYKDFIDLNTQVVLISFGTSFQPAKSELMNLMQAVGKLPIGFIMSIKDANL